MRKKGREGEERGKRGLTDKDRSYLFLLVFRWRYALHDNLPEEIDRNKR